MKKYAIIVAGGKGVRMGADVPKQFLLLNNKPALMHTMEAFYQYDKGMEIVLVLPENQLIYWNELKARYSFGIAHRVVAGGETRFHSVKNGLRCVERDSYVAVHDGVRALITSSLIGRVFDALADADGAYPAVAVSDTLRKWEPSEGKYIQVDRAQYRSTQTPQVFRSQIILSAYNQEYSDQFTDDVSVVEKYHPQARIKVVEGSTDNIKMTRPEDLAVAEALLKCRT